MKKLVLLFSLLFVGTNFIAASAFADDDATNSLMNRTALACISTGIQNYYQNKTKDLDNPPQIIPSDKWLAFLGAMEVQTGWLKKDRKPGDKFKLSDNNIVQSAGAKEIYQEDIIAKIQAYGFCTSFVSKSTIRATHGARDLDAHDWTTYVLPAITGNTTGNINLTDKDMQIMGGFFGFANPMLGKKSNVTMGQLINGDDPDRSIFQNASITERREAFKVRLQQAIDSSVASGDKDNGLGVCLQQMQRNLNSNDPVISKFASSNNESVAFCRSMADSCNLDVGFCSSYSPPPRKSNPNTGGISVGIPSGPSGGALPPPPPLPGQQ